MPKRVLLLVYGSGGMYGQNWIFGQNWILL